MKIRFFLLSVITFLLSLGTAYAVTGNTWTVKGLVKSKSCNQPLEFATIALYTTDSNKLVQGCVSDSLGCYSMTDVPDGGYRLVISYIGCDDIKKDLSVKGNTTVPVVYVNDGASTSLQEVVVKGHKSAFVQHIDRNVYDVKQDMMASTGSLSDVLQHIPSLDVDLDGNISLRGNENVTILVNGRPSTMFTGKSRGDILQQLPANSIEKIEVINNPSAQYKPDGTSGIINIIMKKDAKSGLNGTLKASVGNKSRAAAGAGLSWGTDKWNISGSYNYRKDRYDRTTDDTRESSSGHVSQQTVGIGHPDTHTFQLGGNVNITPRDVFSASASYARRNFRRTENVKSATTDLTGKEAENYSRTRDANAVENIWDIAAQYSHTVNKNSKWGIDYNYSSGTENESNDYATGSTLPTEYVKYSNEHVSQGNYLHVGKLHWTYKPAGKGQFDFGYELEHQKTDVGFHVSEKTGTAYVPNVMESSDFSHYRDIHSLYATFEQAWGKWDLSLGVRGEYVHQKSYFHNSDSTIYQNYANIYPSFHLMNNLNDHNSINFSYSLRVNRPDGEDMNPYTEHINPLSLQSGNPNLKPEKIHSLETGWMWHNDVNATLSATLYYRYTVNKITTVSRYISDNVLLTTKENMNNNQSAGLEIVWSYRPFNWISFNINMNGFYNEINASRLGYGGSRSSWAWDGLMNADIMPFSNFTLQMNTKYRSSRLVPQGRRDRDYVFNLGAKYDLPKTGLTMTASVSDLFNTSRKSYTIDTEELKQKVIKRRNPRIIWVGLTYNFGLNKKKGSKIEYDDNYK
jgi:outer membrane receptor protein involved in Fe transport